MHEKNAKDSGYGEEPGAGRDGWTRWHPHGGLDLTSGDHGAARLQLTIFRVLASLAVVGLLFIAVRSILIGQPFPLADVANALLFVLLFALSFAKRCPLRCLVWLGLISFFVNAIDGLQYVGVVPHALILTPMLVLYGALLGDIWVSLAALVGVAAMYAYTWSSLGHLPTREMLILTDVCLLTLFSGAAALSVWLRHRRLEKELALQAAVLREEMDLRTRLQAIIAHDVRNPLMVLLSAADAGDPQTVQAMAQQVSAIVDSAGDLVAGSDLKLSDVTVPEIGIHLKEVFATRLARKGQALNVAAAPAFTLATDVALLCNSVLGNILSNAIKFSPRESTIALSAEREGEFIRMVITDQGSGFPPDVLKCGTERRGRRSQPGTDGERGTGYGLPIAALCAERLGGFIEIRNRDHGGAAVSVLLPRLKNHGGAEQVKNSAS